MDMTWFCNGADTAGCGWFLVIIGTPIVMAIILWMTEK